MSKMKGILLVSFGTSYEEARVCSIDVMEEEIRRTYQEAGVYTAWTSGMIIGKVRDRDGYLVDTVAEAMEKMAVEGVRDVVVQPTHVVNGIENDRMKEDVLAFTDRFNSILFGDPLLTREGDYGAVINVLMGELKVMDLDTALVFMGHGTSHYANSVYAALDYQFKDMGYSNVYVGTVEAYPSLESLKRFLKEGGYRKLVLTPFMIVAGDHARHDMAGGEVDSWKYQFEELGYEVECVLKGLGEYKGVRELFLEHLDRAVRGL